MHLHEAIAKKEPYIFHKIIDLSANTLVMVQMIAGTLRIMIVIWIGICILMTSRLAIYNEETEKNYTPNH